MSNKKEKPNRREVTANLFDVNYNDLIKNKIKEIEMQYTDFIIEEIQEREREKVELIFTMTCIMNMYLKLFFN